MSYMDDYVRIITFLNKRSEKDIKECPCCGGSAYFRPASSLSYKIICNDCGMSSAEVMIPDYWKKKHHYIFDVYFKCLKKWNTRKTFMKIGNTRVEIR